MADREWLRDRSVREVQPRRTVTIGCNLAVNAHVRPDELLHRGVAALDGKTIDLPPVGNPKTEEPMAASMDAAPPQAVEPVGQEPTLFDMEAWP